MTSTDLKKIFWWITRTKRFFIFSILTIYFSLRLNCYYKCNSIYSLWISNERKNWFSSAFYDILKAEQGDLLHIEEKAKGIYSVDGMLFPLQIIVTKKLDQKKHAWLHSLTRSMKYASAQNLFRSCEGLENTTDKKNAGVVMDFVSNVNESLFLEILKEDECMTEALKILIEPELMNLRLIINNKDAEIADKDAKIADKDAKIAGKDAEIAGKNAEIASKDAEIAKLKQQLLEATQQHKKA